MTRADRPGEKELCGRHLYDLVYIALYLISNHEAGKTLFALIALHSSVTQPVIPPKRACKVAD